MKKAFEWDIPRLERIFRASVRGHPVSDVDTKYAEAAYASDAERYAEIRRPVVAGVHRAMNPWAEK